MSFSIDQRRATGRTTRLIADAVRLTLEERKAVYVVVDNQKMIRPMERLIRKYLIQNVSSEQVSKNLQDNPALLLGIKVETPATLGAAWSWKNLRVTGAHERCVFLVDHWTIENRFKTMLEALHKYDE